MENNAALVDHLTRRRVLPTTALREAFLTVDRRLFVPVQYIRRAYGDHPLSIGHGQTISQPYTVAFMLSKLVVKPGQSVLDVGTGSAWTTALLAFLVGNKGHVIGTERIHDLVRFGQENLARFHFAHAAIEQAGKVVGIPGRHFDRILVSAAAREIPKALVEQLAPDGHMVLPVGASIVHVHKDNIGVVKTREHYGFSFVPLIE